MYSRAWLYAPLLSTVHYHSGDGHKCWDSSWIGLGLDGYGEDRVKDTVNTRLDYNCQGDGRRGGSREREVPTSRAKTTHQYRNATQGLLYIFG
jgi:hypothetical protein